ncbi:unnamed protein product [Orchesella dallaii]|uniref:AB hydrolase-1 domain-containing protein n=1 Tax=Orchesella dallaii TaxID=48710 RepID=A0ABP1RVC4_9HEXA
MMLTTLTIGGIIIGSQLVLAQRFPPSQYFRPIRACRAHQPLQTNRSTDLLACTRETFRVSNIQDLDVDKNIVQISHENGYLIDSYNVTTSDGYILTLFRISGGRKSPARRGKPSVLLLHGWGNSCEAWIALPNDKNLVFMLADAGWDVWLGNFRGSSFSLQHTILNADRNLNFWDFSFHELGLFDFPVMLDQARRVSENDKVFVIGHSQGATATLVAASEVPGINEKIHAAYLMAPAVYIGGAYDPLTTPMLPIASTPGEDLIYNLLQGRIQLRNPRLLFSSLGIQPKDICQSRTLRCKLCDLPTLTPFIFNHNQMNYTNIPRMVSKLFDYATVKSFLHQVQNARSCSFRYYDRGARENLRRYGSRQPPSYNLNRVRGPIYLFWAEQDANVTPSDIQRLVSALPSETVRAVIRVNDDTFNHEDFSVGRDANVLVYKPLIDMMTEFNDRFEAGI